MVFENISNLRILKEKVLIIVSNIYKAGVRRSTKAKIMLTKLQLFSYPLVCTCVLGAQKNRLSETVLLSTHNIFLVEK